MVIGNAAIIKRLNQMDHTIYNSFGNVKRDMDSIFQWLDYLYHQNQEQEDQIAQLQHELRHTRAQLRYMPKTREEIKHLIDSHYSFEPVLERIKRLAERVDELAQQQKPLVQEVSSIGKKVEGLGEKKETVKEKLVKKLTRNSKRYVKNIILSMIQKYERIPALQLRDIIVEEQGLCSKSSFYRLLAELEQEDFVDVLQDGKEKIYLFKAINYPRKS